MQTHTKWLHVPRNKQLLPPSAKLRLFCLPMAGSGSWMYHSWFGKLPDFVEIMPVELPGRGMRTGEPSMEDMKATAAAVVENLLPYMKEMPFALFGHSMGSWLAYEVARELERRVARGEPGIRLLKLYASAARSPALYGPENDMDGSGRPMHLETPDVFWERFFRRYGDNPDLRQNPAAREFAYPVLLADFKSIETYKMDDLPPLKIPLTAFGGTQDTRYKLPQIAAWKPLTCAEFAEHLFEAGHMYASQNPEPLLEYLSRDLTTLIQTLE